MDLIVNRIADDCTEEVWMRAVRAVVQECDREEMHALAKELSLDIETVKMLSIYEQTFVTRKDSTTVDIRVLRRHADRIRTMGQLFEGFGLARHVKGTAFAWTPRQSLRRMLAKRWRLLGVFDFSVPGELDRFNMTYLAVLSEFADTLEVLLDLIPALRIKKKWLKQCKQTRKLWDLIALTRARRLTGLEESEKAVKILRLPRRS